MKKRSIVPRLAVPASRPPPGSGAGRGCGGSPGRGAPAATEPAVAVPVRAGPAILAGVPALPCPARGERGWARGPCARAERGVGAPALVRPVPLPCLAGRFFSRGWRGQRHPGGTEPRRPPRLTTTGLQSHPAVCGALIWRGMGSCGSSFPFHCPLASSVQPAVMFACVLKRVEEPPGLRRKTLGSQDAFS